MTSRGEGFAEPYRVSRGPRNAGDLLVAPVGTRRSIGGEKAPHVPVTSHVAALTGSPTAAGISDGIASRCSRYRLLELELSFSLFRGAAKEPARSDAFSASVGRDGFEPRLRGRG